MNGVKNAEKKGGLSVNDFQKKYLLKRQDYGVLYPYVIEENVTDINWNGKQLWIDHVEKGRYMAPDVLTEDFVERFVVLIANVTNQNLNRLNPVMEAETEELRISIVHEWVAHTGTTISLRKIPAVRRLDKREMLLEGYCEEKILIFLRNCIACHCSVIIAGLPGAGKTELLKYLTKFIPAAERVITIEDVLEIHYQKINPNKDCVEMKVAEHFSYSEAIKACLRQLPKWIILSEVRSTEVRYLLETLSTGASSITTIHADDVRNIPERIRNMSGEKEDSYRIENDTYRYIDIGILVKSVTDTEGKVRRYIDQIGIFNRYGKDWKQTINEICMLVEEGNMVTDEIPDNMKRRMKEEGIENPFVVTGGDIGEG